MLFETKLHFSTLICHYQTNFTKIQFFLIGNMQSYHFYQTWPRRILSRSDNELKQRQR